MSLIGLSPIFVAFLGLLFLWFNVHYQTLRRLRLQVDGVIEEWQSCKSRFLKQSNLQADKFVWESIKNQENNSSDTQILIQEMKVLRAKYVSNKTYYEQTAQGLPARLAPKLFGVVKLPELL